MSFLGISMAGLERDPVARRSGADRAAQPQGKRADDAAGVPATGGPIRASMLRVDQAGEYGATRIYAGQLAVLRPNCPEAKLIARMAAQEERHLERFNA